MVEEGSGDERKPTTAEGEAVAEELIEPGPTAVDISPKGDGGVLKEILREGESDLRPGGGSKVTVHYEGKLTDGTPFDSSRERSPFSFDLGKGNVIKAWDIGVATMKKGELCRLFCREDYAYGQNGSPPKIPPGATLVFEIEMLDWEAEDLSSKKDKGILRFRLDVGQESDSPKEGTDCVVHLVGEHEGKVFDEREVEFCLGEGIEKQVPPGVERALEKFNLLEKSRLELKPQYGFGSAGCPSLGVPPNASLVYTVTLKSFIKAKDAWMLENKEKLELASVYKEKGTNYFKSQKYQLALKMYKKVLEFLKVGSGFEEDLEPERKSLLLAANLNLAMCYLKVDNFTLARGKCEDALEVDPNSVKALFRRGQSLMGLNEPELAKKDFERVLTLDPTNKAVPASIAAASRKMKEVRDKERQIYANMFDRYNKKSEWRYGWWDETGKPVVEEQKEEEPDDEEDPHKADLRAKRQFIERAKKLREERLRIQAEEAAAAGKTEGGEDQGGEAAEGQEQGPEAQESLVNAQVSGEEVPKQEEVSKQEEVPPSHSQQPLAETSQQ